MEFKTKFQQTIIEFVKSRLKPASPLICISDTGTGKTTALAYSALDSESSVVVLCPGKRSAVGFLDTVRSILNKRRQPYKYADEDYIKINDKKKIHAYPISQSTWDVDIDDDVEYVFFDDAQHLHPMVLRRLIMLMEKRKVVITSDMFILELKGVVKNKITN